MTGEDKQVELVRLARQIIKLDKADKTGEMAWEHMKKLTEITIQKLDKDDIS